MSTEQLFSTIQELFEQQLQEIPNTREGRMAMVHVLAHIFAVVVDNGEDAQERLALLSLGLRFMFHDLPITTERKDC